MTPAADGLPPCCPRCRVGPFRVFLASIRPNHAGDEYFECLGCGYEAIYRVRTGQFEPCPWGSADGWQPPLVFTLAGPLSQKSLTVSDTQTAAPACPPEEEATRPARGELAGNPEIETCTEDSGLQTTPKERKDDTGHANTEGVEPQTHGVAPGDASTDPAADALQHPPESRTTGEGSNSSARREDKHRRAHVRATQEGTPMKRSMTADEDDSKPEEAPASSRSNPTGDGVGRDGNGVGRKGKKKVTPKQIEANRRNSLESTGPKTLEGKAHVRLNPLKHGILAQEVLLPGEDEHALADLERRLWDDWQPVGAHEEFLLDLILRQIWRLRRAGRLEAAILAAEQYKISLDRAQTEVKQYERIEPSRDPLEFMSPPPPPKPIITDERKHQEALASAAEAKALVRGELATFGWAFMQVVAGADPFSKLSRYETAILRSLDRAFEQLRLLQQARLGKAAPTAHIKTRRRVPGPKARTRYPRRSRRQERHARISRRRE